MASILVIDDEELTRSFLRTTLERGGYQVVEASTAQEGIRQYHESSIDLVITDILMPDKDGIGLIIELKREFPDVKIIAITGGGRDLNFLDAAKLLGAHQCLTKPFSREKLLEVIQSSLEE